ncbi:Ycf48-like protein precursor [bacterium BMS3Bbin03]|nr:Ycf48-like protein precursor [bacterium BMS3Bbin03]
MRKILPGMLVIGFFFTTSVFGNNPWTSVVTPTFQESIYGISFPTKDLGWVVGSNGMILGTDDGGKTWNFHDNVSTKKLTSVVFPDEKNGWIAGYDGTLLKTADGGQTWAQSGNFTTADDFLKVFFINATHGWVVGKKGVLYRTTDSTNWTAPSDLGGVTEDIYAVHFADETHGIMATKYNLLYTTDGGDHWTPAESLDFGGYKYFRNDFKAVFMVNDTVAYATGWGSMAAGLQPTLLMKTTDGGRNWKFLDQSLKTYCYGYAIAFTDENNGYIVGGGAGYGSLILKTTDGGQTFTPMPIFTGNTLYAIQILDGRIWAAGALGELAYSDDGARSWTLSYRIPDILNYYAVAAPDSHTVFAAGWNGGVLKSTDDGKNWQFSCVAEENRAVRIEDLFFLNKDYGWTAGGYGSIARTTDGGKTWTGLQILKNARAAFYGIYFLDVNTGFACGKNSSGEDIIQWTTDGGINWTTVLEDSTHKPLYDIFFYDASHGVAVGGDSSIVFTADGGMSWKRARHDFPVKADFKSVYFAGPSNGWIVGKSARGGKSVVLKSADGGAAWKTMDWGTGLNFDKVYFQNAAHGWIIGKKGAVFETADSGATWNPVDVMNENNLQDVAQAPGGQPWIVGTNTTVLTKPVQTRVEEFPEQVPLAVGLLQNYPNPFNPVTTISFSIPQTSRVRLSIFNVQGEWVQTLLNEKKTAGRYSVRWNAGPLPSGVYFYRIQAGTSVATKKLLLLK